MKAWILAVGSELLTPEKIDTNSLAITERLNVVGYDVRFKAVLGDDCEEIAEMLGRGIGRADLVVCTGGLGPTEDDLTRDALARALGLPLDLHEDILERIRQRFAARNIRMPEINRRQAMVPRGATVVPNANGTAPGLWIERDGTFVLVLPGPPREMLPMLEQIVRERLAPKADGAGLFRRVLKITGLSESEVDARSQPVYGPWTTAAVPIATTILASMGQIELHLAARAASAAAADAVLEPAVAALRTTLGDVVYSATGQSLEQVTGALLAERGWTIALGESCTGGLLASRLTDVPGSSAYFDRSAVCYSNTAKEEWLDVPAALIAAHGAVSEPVAQAMAAGARARAGADVGIGITGIAGPGGGTAEKPVGTVAIAVTTPLGDRVRTWRFVGGREMVKFQSTQAAMNLLRLLVLEIDRTAASR